MKPWQKARWLQESSKEFPIGTQVKILGSDVTEYIGLTGTVIGYDPGVRDEHPMMIVSFSHPFLSTNVRDGFFSDELLRADQSLH